MPNAGDGVRVLDVFWWPLAGGVFVTTLVGHDTIRYRPGVHVFQGTLTAKLEAALLQAVVAGGCTECGTVGRVVVTRMNGEDIRSDYRSACIECGARP